MHNKYKYLELNSQVTLDSLDKDQEALSEYLKYIEDNLLIIESPLTNEQAAYFRIKYLVDNRYYCNFFKYYSIDDIKRLIDIAYNYKFKFGSFMAAYQFYNSYALRSNDKKTIYERYEDRIVSSSLFLARNNPKEAERLIRGLMEQRFQPATPIFLNAGKKKRGELVSCFLLDVDDSLNSITYNLSTAMQLSKIGGGVSLNLSKMRAKGESIKGMKNATKGVLPMMKLLEDAFNYIDQMGQRKGAGAVYLNIFHYDILDFLDTKKINADEKSRIQTLSLGVIIPDKFFELCKENKDINLFAPGSVYKLYGKHFDEMDIDHMYDELSHHPDVIKKSVPARDLLLMIAKLQFESGYPYIMFKDNANRQNPLKGINSIKMSNICTEILQIQEVTYISDDNLEDVIGYDINCVLGSVNIDNVMKTSTGIKDTVYLAVDTLTSVTDYSEIKNAKSVRRANELFHSIGVGAMNLQGYLIKLGIEYDSEEAKEFCDIFFMMMNYYSLKRSMEIAKDREQTFFEFSKSEYKNGNYFANYITKKYEPTHSKVVNIFKDIYIPTPQDWHQLKDDVQKYGVYHAYRLAIAPTGKISYLQNATPSIMPITEHIESRLYLNSTIYYPEPYLTKENISQYKLGYNIDMYKFLDLISVIQTHVDQGISCSLFINSETSTRTLMKYYLYAHKLGIKTLYYTRTKNLSITDCTACAI